MRHAAALLLALTSPAWAQNEHGGEGQDARFKVIEYVPGDIVHVTTSPGTLQTLLLAPGDQIKSVIISDPAAYTITVEGSGDSIALKPNSRTSLAMMSVHTELRSYDFELAPGEAGAVSSIVRFSYGPTAKSAMAKPAPPAALASVPETPGVNYRLSGPKELRPFKIGDDGRKTYIAWQDDQPMPAIFAVNAAGKEEMVEGSVRGRPVHHRPDPRATDLPDRPGICERKACHQARAA
jgi:type IV secretion system protein VirB9